MSRIINHLRSRPASNQAPLKVESGYKLTPSVASWKVIDSCTGQIRHFFNNEDAKLFCKQSKYRSIEREVEEKPHREVIRQVKSSQSRSFDLIETLKRIANRGERK
jgi:hypothetical protein